MKALFKLGSGLILGAFAMTSLAAYSGSARYKDGSLYSPADAPVSGWNGFYVGGNLGYGWSSQSVNLYSAPGSALATAIGVNSIPQQIANRPNGTIGGIQAGYNYQYDRTLIGVEADYQLADMVHDQTKVSTVVGFPAYSTTVQQKLDALGSLRVRLGFAANDVLMYLSTGLAYGHAQLSSTITNPGCVNFCGQNSTNYNMAGWIWGAGLEYAFTEHWSAKAEYMYYIFGGRSQRLTDASIPGAYIGEKVDFDGNFIRLGVNYKFQ